MKEFTQKLLSKSNIAPVVHEVIIYVVTRNWRKCINKVEQMQATKEHHEHWMANSAAEEVCSFFEILSMDGLGARGIKLKPDRVVTEKDISTIMLKGKTLSEKTKQNFINAHGKNIAELFRAPENPHKDFFTHTTSSIRREICHQMTWTINVGKH